MARLNVDHTCNLWQNQLETIPIEFCTSSVHFFKRTSQLDFMIFLDDIVKAQLANGFLSKSYQSNRKILGSGRPLSNMNGRVSLNLSKDEKSRGLKKIENVCIIHIKYIYMNIQYLVDDCLARWYLTIFLIWKQSLRPIHTMHPISFPKFTSSQYPALFWIRVIWEKFANNTVKIFRVRP